MIKDKKIKEPGIKTELSLTSVRLWGSNLSRILMQAVAYFQITDEEEPRPNAFEC
jgi:hypothetical protein